MVDPATNAEQDWLSIGDINPALVIVDRSANGADDDEDVDSVLDETGTLATGTSESSEAWHHISSQVHERAATRGGWLGG